MHGLLKERGSKASCFHIRTRTLVEGKENVNTERGNAGHGTSRHEIFVSKCKCDEPQL